MIALLGRQSLTNLVELELKLIRVATVGDDLITLGAMGDKA